MPMPLSQEIRSKIVFHKTNGNTNADIAHWLRINEKTVRRIWRLYKEQNSVDPKPHNKGRKPAFGQDVMDKIVARIKEQSDITLEELVEEFNLKISISALCRKLQKLNLNFKKRHYSQKSSNEKTFRNFAKNG
jgi:transposase